MWFPTKFSIKFYFAYVSFCYSNYVQIVKIKFYFVFQIIFCLELCSLNLVLSPKSILLWNGNLPKSSSLARRLFAQIPFFSHSIFVCELRTESTAAKWRRLGHICSFFRKMAANGANDATVRGFLHQLLYSILDSSRHILLPDLRTWNNFFDWISPLE